MEGAFHRTVCELLHSYICCKFPTTGAVDETREHTKTINKQEIILSLNIARRIGNSKKHALDWLGSTTSKNIVKSRIYSMYCNPNTANS